MSRRVGRRNVGNWSPLMLGPAAGYRSDTGITVATGVSQWNDITGNGHNVTQPTPSSQPTLNTSDAAYAGRPSLSFAFGASQWLVGAITIAQPDTLFIIGHVTVAASASEFVDSGNVTRHLVGVPSGSANLQLYAGTGPVTSTTAVSSPSAIVATMNGGSAAAYVNNSAVAALSGNAGTNALTQIGIGGGVAGGYLNGKIVEVWVFARALSLPERALCMTYASRYGISTT